MASAQQESEHANATKVEGGVEVGAPTPAPTDAPSSSSSSSASSEVAPAVPVMTRADVVRETMAGGPRRLIIIANKVYDVNGFAPDHPGGPEVFDEYYGNDATAAFESTGHSSVAVRQLARYFVANIHPSDEIHV